MAERKPDIRPKEAKDILEALAQGAPLMETAAMFDRATNTIRRVQLHPELYLMSHKERLRKGLSIPLSSEEEKRMSLRKPTRRAEPEAPYDPQISDSQVSFDFAVALLKKATSIVEALARQQHPPQLMALVQETIEAAVKLQVASRIADTLPPIVEDPPVPVKEPESPKWGHPDIFIARR